MEKPCVMVVDDEKEIADLVEVCLENEGYRVVKYYSPLEALAGYEKVKPDLGIIDIMMPGMDGLTLCRRIREKAVFPIIMLTAKTGDLDKITGLANGADDYLTKPFNPLELVARVKAQLRRYLVYQLKEQGEEAHVIEINGLVIDNETHEVTLYDKPLRLTPTEFEILWLSCKNRGRVIS